MTVSVVPAIIPKDFDDLEAHMVRVKGLVERVQVDIANGSYAPTTTWPYNDMTKQVSEQFARIVREDEGLPFWRELDVEVDMLVAEPEKYLDGWIHAGIVGTVIHIESTRSYSQILKNLRIAEMEVGWGMRPNTPNDELFRIIKEHGMPDFVQVMGNDRIGYHGAELDERVYEKVKTIRRKFPDLTIAVDIGVNEETAPKLVEAGVNKLVAGSAIFESGDAEEAIDYFQQLGSTDYQSAEG
ncbi:hypothetical protein L0Y40_01800 [Candidatus Wolfebacteria bacterium]|nr:hypothetical protein [Candidatus Wolfebacteria bacterium]